MSNFWKGLLFVRKCTVCGRALPEAEENTVFCAECFREYLKLCRDVCPQCERTEKECRCVPEKLRGKVGFAAHLFAYRDAVSHSIVYSLKLKNLPYLQRFLAHELSDLVMDVTGGDLRDLTVTYAPRKPSSVRVYGFDQSKVLATLAAERMGVPLTHMFRHARFSKLQKRLNVKQREENADKSYFLRADFVRTTDKLLILDDVMTTGSTLSSLIGLARDAGFREISVVCIAKTGRT
jgi:predicted amidophosphoribosyltransferase